MKTIYILSNDSRIVKATMSLDESTLWKANGGFTVEVPFIDGETLDSFINDEQEVSLMNSEGETVATFRTELYNDPQEHLLHDCSASHYTTNIEVGRVIAFDKNLEDLNLTKDLQTEIMLNCEELAEIEQNELSKSITHLDNARLWPENLGAGKPYETDELLEDYLELLIRQRMNQSEKSAILLHKINIEFEQYK